MLTYQCDPRARADSIFKHSGMQMYMVESIKKALTGKPSDKARLAERRIDLVIFATGHNFVEVLAAVAMLLLLFAEAVVRATGLKPNGSLASVATPWFLETGMLSGWRGGVTTEETAVVLAVVLFVRVVATLFEEKINAKYRHHSAKYVELLVRDGPANLRKMNLVFIIAIFFVWFGETAMYGKEQAEAEE